LVRTEELIAECADDDEFILSRPRKLAMFAVLGFALLLPVAPAVMAGWSVVDSGGLDRLVTRFGQVANFAGLVQLGRLPLILVLVTLLARSPKEQ
jgi:hypothetical protein